MIAGSAAAFAFGSTRSEEAGKLPEVARFEIRLKNHYAELELAHTRAEAFLEMHGFSGDTRRAVHIGLDEAISNILKYGYDDTAEHEIEVAIVLSSSEIAVTVVDDGHAFDPLQHVATDFKIPLEEREPGRLGIHFIRHLFDEVAYQRENGRNHLTMQKRLTERPHEQPAAGDR